MLPLHLVLANFPNFMICLPQLLILFCHSMDSSSAPFDLIQLNLSSSLHESFKVLLLGGVVVTWLHIFQCATPF